MVLRIKKFKYLYQYNINVASWTGGSGAGSRPSLSRTGSSSNGTNRYGGKTSGTYKTSSGQTYTVKETSPEERKYKVPTKTTSGETINYVRGGSSSTRNDGTTTVTDNYYGVTSSGRFVGGYSESTSYATNGKSTIYAEKQPSITTNKNYTSRPDYALAEPISNVQLKNIIQTTQAKSKDFATVAKSKGTFDVNVYDANNQQAAKITFFTSAKEQQMIRQEEKKAVVERERSYTESALVAKDIGNSNQFLAVKGAIDIASQPRKYREQSVFISQKTADPNRRFYTEETARKFAKPIGKVTPYLNPFGGFLTPKSTKQQISNTTEDFFTGVFNAPNKMIQTPIASTIDFGADITTGYFTGVGVGSITSKTFATTAKKEGVVIAVQKAEKVQSRFNTAFGALAVTSIAVNPKGTGEQALRVIPFGGAYTKGFSDMAGSGVTFGNVQGSTIERFNKDFFGTGKTTAKITEYGNVRTEEVPLAISIQREGSLKPNVDLINTNIVGSYNFMGKTKYFESSFSGALKENAFSSRLSYANKNVIFSSFGDSKAMVRTPTGVVETLRARSVTYERSKYGNFGVTQKGRGNIFYGDNGQMQSISFMRTQSATGFSRRKADIGLNLLEQSGRSPRTSQQQYRDFVSGRRINRKGQIGVTSTTDRQSTIFEPITSGKGRFRSTIEGSPTTTPIRSTAFKIGFLPSLRSGTSTVTTGKIQPSFKVPFGQVTTPNTITTPTSSFRSTIAFTPKSSFRTSVTTLQRPISPPISPVPRGTPGFVPGFGLPPLGGGVMGKGRSEGYRGNREFKYAPSITSILYGIKGKQQKTFTGFELRPITR